MASLPGSKEGESGFAMWLLPSPTHSFYSSFLAFFHLLPSYYRPPSPALYLQQIDTSGHVPTRAILGWMEGAGRRRAGLAELCSARSLCVVFVCGCFTLCQLYSHIKSCNPIEVPAPLFVGKGQLSSFTKELLVIVQHPPNFGTTVCLGARQFRIGLPVTGVLGHSF